MNHRACWSAPAVYPDQLRFQWLLKQAKSQGWDNEQ